MMAPSKRKPSIVPVSKNDYNKTNTVNRQKFTVKKSSRVAKKTNISHTKIYFLCIFRDIEIYHLTSERLHIQDSSRGKSPTIISSFMTLIAYRSCMRVMAITQFASKHFPNGCIPNQLVNVITTYTRHHFLLFRFIHRSN